MTPKTFHWNGSDLPEEFRSLPPGRYLVEPVDQPYVPTPDEEAAIMQGIAELNAGQSLPLEEVIADLRTRIRAK